MNKLWKMKWTKWFWISKLSPNQANLFTYLVYKIKGKRCCYFYDEADGKLDFTQKSMIFQKSFIAVL